MRHVIWDCFQVTGSIDAYLLYKDFQMIDGERREQEQNENGEEE